MNTARKITRRNFLKAAAAATMAAGFSLSASAAGPEERETLELAVRFGLAALEHGEDCRP